VAGFHKLELHEDDDALIVSPTIHGIALFMWGIGQGDSYATDFSSPNLTMNIDEEGLPPEARGAGLLASFLNDAE
jgi:hypothetical protein